MSTTTIRVSKELHQRIAQHAHDEQTTLAGAIERAFDAGDRARFWADAAVTMDSTSSRRALLAENEVLAGTLADGLEPAESWDGVW